jgi:hypothetical protein
VNRRQAVLATLALALAAAASLAQGPPEDGGAVQAERAAALARRRDPFRPFTLDIHPNAARVQLTPLQRYELGQLTVVGTIWAVNPPRGMLEDSSGMGYIVTIGTPIGRNGGVVTAIEPERIIVEEHTLDFYGKEQVSRVVMETPKEDPNSAKGK